MNPGFYYLAEHSEPAQAIEAIVHSLAKVGAHLAHPSTGRVTRLVGGGDAIETTEADLIRSIAFWSEATPQFWFSADTYLGCNFRRLDTEVVCHAYSVDGLDADQRRRLLNWALEYFRSCAAQGTAVLLVGDPAGLTADVDWDEVVARGAPFPEMVPQVLGFPIGRRDDLRSVRSHSKERVGSYELWTHRSSD